MDWEQEAKYWESLLSRELPPDQFIIKPMVMSCLTLCRVLASGKEVGDRDVVEKMARARMESRWGV